MSFEISRARSGAGRLDAVDLARCSKSRALDQFYTAPDVAAACLDKLCAYLATAGITPALWVEPSAGAGAFLERLPSPRVGIDLDPRCPEAEKADFLAWAPPTANGPIVAAGNPPFGKNASLAIRFFNHAAAFADIIAFIVPRTFEKTSVQRRLNDRFHLEQEIALRPDAFLFEGHPRAVPCVFQIWRRRSTPRAAVRPVSSHPDFAFCGPEEADVAFQRIGANAGRVKDKPGTRSPSSHVFIRDLTPDRRVASVLAGIDWTDIKGRTAGCPSIGRSEIASAYAAALANAQGTALLAA